MLFVEQLKNRDIRTSDALCQYSGQFVHAFAELCMYCLTMNMAEFCMYCLTMKVAEFCMSCLNMNFA